jgi:hypothetical protein
MEEPLLNSDKLFHFTSKSNTISLILQNGFRYSGLNEKIISEDKSQLIFGVSFCDIPFKDTGFHRDCYGSYGLVMEKDWGIKNGISPVRYIHENSPGATELYLKIKKNLTELKHYYHNVGDVEYSILYLYSLIVLSESDNAELNYNKVISNREVENARDEFVEFYEFLKNNHKKYAELFTKYMELYTYRLSELHNELYHRDLYMRNYSESFACPKNEKIIKNKILYNEREWRAVKRISLKRDTPKSEYDKLLSYAEQNYLPKEYNMKFSESDIFAILIEKKEDKGEILSEIEKGSVINPEKIADKFFLLSEFQEFCGYNT